MTSILGLSTIRLVKGALGEITEEKWNALNKEPVGLSETERADHLTKRSLLQTCLYRMTQHLATASLQSDDFIKFSEAIELVHSELATFLQLTRPMKDSEFENIYKQQLHIVPEILQDHVQAGISKSAMNTFAGICTLVMSTTPNPQIVHGENSYFEEIDVVGKNRGMNEVLAHPVESGVDLYVGEFNHNININKDYHHYVPGDVIGDVAKLLKINEKLMDGKPKPLTVAIDSTIDLVNSKKAQQFLNRFSKEIEEGSLNVVFFRSGQKFEMLGMDNYYGSPFYMINNGEKQWEAFKALKTEEVFNTDPLSKQWFCLLNKYAPQQLDDYRALIFKNSREIINKIPAELKDPNSPVIVSTVDSGMDPAFIDIKVLGKMDYRTIETIFYNKMMEAGRKVHSRGSFGFYHPNFNFIPDVNHVNIRINPGLDPKDNEIIVDILKEIVKELKTG